ncbi:FAD/NAD(P)-binding domain-containing protein [Myriangium duriaei CBS 260.36]|uniref:FAD/NAD(P)-binding domain-containing protein n=1 Tax=Myriangium duriaei CBS 260.36 TaxID=1168546 RepID=A0A9P4MFV5_9PEZI|nr:FAD/NAD(P)-binding domain-containing protein [Myriangium duriaei CBS 260.36]
MSSSSESALKIVIVGAGIGGLSAAVALRQQGHEVVILESSKFSNETGAAIHVAPNCTGILRRLGLDIRKNGANEMTGLARYTPDGAVLGEQDLTEINQLWQHQWLLVHRAYLHTALREKATGDGAGKPADLRLNSKVANVDPVDGVVTLEDGQIIHGDLIVGADGVHSKARAALGLGNEYIPYDCGDSAFRWMVPREELEADPMTKDLVKIKGWLYLVMGPDRRLVWYPCNDNKLINFLLIHPSSETRAEGAGWNQKGDKNKLIECGKSFADKYKRAMEKAPEDSLKVWTLLDMKVIPTWTKGRLALIGDAAHPFLPHQGQGGAQAIEDAVSLAAVLPRGTSFEDIADRISLYERVRKGRADRIQHFTRLSGKSATDVAAAGEKFDPVQFNLYNFCHDEWDHSTHALRKHLWSKHPYRYRQPLSFGPSPGPRMPQNMLPGTFTHNKQSQTVYTMRFKTSRTYLQNLFPTDQFSFTSPGTFAQASLSCCSLKNMTWLGGTGYNHLGLYVHGVQYTKKNGEKLHGTFMPILFESLTDPIITGQEEIAAPKWGCDIDISTIGNSQLVKMSWRGTDFCQLRFDDLAEQTSDDSSATIPKPQPDDGILLYRYVPAVGEPGKADAEYAVFDPRNPEQWDGTTKKVAVARKPAISISEGTWQTLPTIHHIVKELSNIPIYRILESSINSLDSVGDVSGARRVYEE